MTPRIPFGPYRLTADSHQWVVVEPKTRGSGPNAGETYDAPVGYCSELGAALKLIAERRLRDSDATTLSQLRTELAAFHADVTQLIDPRQKP